MLSITVAVKTANVVGPDSTNMLGVNLTYWDTDLTTTQTQQAVESAGLQLYRFPGGSDSEDFHFNLAENDGDVASNSIPQFAQFITAVGGVGLATLDYGSGSPQEAAAELAYLEGSPGDTTVIGTGLEWNDSTGQWQCVNWQTVGYWASLRASAPLPIDDGLNFMRIGQLAPFSNIKYFEIGDEEYGSWEIDHHGTPGPGGVSTGAQHDPATYAAFAAQFATMANEITTFADLPPISIGIDSGDPTGASDDNWTSSVLADGLADNFIPGFISDHSYMEAPGYENDAALLNGTVTNPDSILDWTTRYNDYEALLTQVLGAQASSVSVMATEYNSVSASPGKQSTSLVNGLFVAEALGQFLESGYSSAFIWDLRNDWEDYNNNSSSLYGWRQGGDYGLLGDPNAAAGPPANGGYVAFPSYYAIQLVSKFDLAGGNVVSSTVCGSSDLNVYSIVEANGHLELLVINTSPSSNLTSQFNLTGFQPGDSAQLWQYGTAQDTAQSTTLDGASALANATTSLAVSGSGFSYTFPAYSMTVLDLTPPPVVTASGASAIYTAGGPAVAIDNALAVSSSDANLSGAIVQISAATLQTGDTLNFTNPGGITGSYNPILGTLTLSGSATVAQYQAALQSVTFSNPTSTSTTSRSISIVADDGSPVSDSASETISVSAPVTISAAYVSGSTWNSTFLAYLGSNSLGSSTYGFALQTGSSAAQLATLPWFNINTITVTFSAAVQDVGQGSLDLVGGSGGTDPAVSGFASLGNNTYQWTLAGSLTNNRYVFAIATTGSSFGTAGSTQVVDANGAGISGTFTTGQNFPSGNGLAATATSPSTFDFFFNVLPGDVNRDNNDNGTDVSLVRPLAVNTRSTSSSYNPYYDVNGDGTINATDLILIRPDTGRLASGWPTAPSDASVGGLAADLALDTATALGVIETTATSSSGGSQSAALSNVVSTATPLGAVPASDDENDEVAIAIDSAVSASIATTTEETNLAADQAISDFDLAEQWV